MQFLFQKNFILVILDYVLVSQNLKNLFFFLFLCAFNVKNIVHLRHMQLQRLFSIQIFTQYELFLGNYRISIDKFLSDKFIVHEP